MPTRMQIARKDIHRALDQHPQQILRRADIEAIFSRNVSEWRLASSTTVGQFIQFLLGPRRLQRIEIEFPSRKETRYVWRSAPLAEVLMTLRPKCYFSHYTAMQMLDLTEQDPRTVYVNFEQSPKPAPASGLSQEGIDRAFKGKPRMAKTIAEVDQYRVCLLNGKHTNYVGIESATVTWGGDSETCNVRISNLERTLIDIAVRPFYAGGPDEVLKAYERAGNNQASATRIGAYLQDMRYIYPYHQAIGFYMEKCGSFMPDAIERFRQRFSFEFDFYLSYGLKDTRRDDRWRLHVPSWM